jgi:hypothetical protein
VVNLDSGVPFPVISVPWLPYGLLDSDISCDPWELWGVRPSNSLGIMIVNPNTETDLTWGAFLNQGKNFTSLRWVFQARRSGCVLHGRFPRSSSGWLNTLPAAGE